MLQGPLSSIDPPMAFSNPPMVMYQTQRVHEVEDKGVTKNERKENQKIRIFGKIYFVFQEWKCPKNISSLIMINVPMKSVRDY